MFNIIQNYTNSKKRIKSNGTALNTVPMYKIVIDLENIESVYLDNKHIILENGIKIFDKNGNDISQNYIDGGEDKEFLNNFIDIANLIFAKTRELPDLPKFKIYISREKGTGGSNNPSGQYAFISTDPADLINRSSAASFATIPDSAELSMSVKGNDPINNLVIDVFVAFAAIILGDKSIEEGVYGNSKKSTDDILPKIDESIKRQSKPQAPSEPGSFVDLTRSPNNNNNQGRTSR